MLITHQRGTDTIPVQRGRLKPVVSNLGFLLCAGVPDLPTLADDLLKVEIITRLCGIRRSFPKSSLGDTTEGFDVGASRRIGRPKLRRGGLIDSNGGRFELVVFVLSQSVLIP